LRAAIAVLLLFWLVIEVFLVFATVVGGGIYDDIPRIAVGIAAWTLTGLVLALYAIALR